MTDWANAISADEAGDYAPPVTPPDASLRRPAAGRTGAPARWLAVMAMSLGLHALVSYGVDFVDSLREDRLRTSEQEIPVELVSEVPGEKTTGQTGGTGPQTKPEATKPEAAQNSELRSSPSTPQTAKSDPAPQPTPPASPALPAAQPSPQPRSSAASPAPAATPPQTANAAPAQQSAALPPHPAGVAPPGPNVRPMAVEVAPASRPDLAPQAQEVPKPNLGKPSKDVIEHLFLPGLFKIVAADETPAATKEEADSYKTIVFDRIIRSRQFPEAARRRGAHGVAVVSMLIDSAGNLAGASLIRSAGDRDLDIEAIAMVRRAAPFPVPPPGSVLTFTPMIEFGLGE